MARPRYEDEWWDKVEEYLREHPEEGFAPDEVKQFIKYAANRYMNTKNQREKVEELLEKFETD